MDDNKTFIDETDYKPLFMHVVKERDELKAQLSDKQDTIEDMEREVTELRLECDSKKRHIDILEGRIDNLQGQVDAFKYCVRNYMVGGGE